MVWSMNAVAEATYRDRIQRAIDYTEENLTRGVSLKGAADAACWSAYHFMRTFHAITGSTYAEYVRDRRLEVAAYRLVFTRDRILDIALQVGYETQEAFTRAFKRSYGSSPGQYRIADAYRVRQPTITVDGTAGPRAPNDAGATMEPTIRELGPITIIGAELRTRGDGSNFKEIPAFWERFMAEKTFSKIPAKTNPDISFGLCTNADEETGDFSYVIGCEVPAGTNAPDGLGEFVIPHKQYLVFTASGPFEGGAYTAEIQRVWKYVYGEWFPASNKWERDDGPDFEVYDEARCTDSAGECDIYIPVRSKE